MADANITLDPGATRKRTRNYKKKKELIARGRGGEGSLRKREGFKMGTVGRNGQLEKEVTCTGGESCG